MSNKLEKIEKLSQKGKSAKLLPFAQSKDPAERAAAVAGLAKCDVSEDSYNGLLAALRDSDIEVKINAVHTLLALKQYNAIEFIRHAHTAESDPRLIAACKEACGGLSAGKTPQ